MKVTIDELLRHTPFIYDRKLKVYKQKHNSISAGEIDRMIALSYISGEYNEQKGVVFIG